MRDLAKFVYFFSEFLKMAQELGGLLLEISSVNRARRGSRCLIH